VTSKFVAAGDSAPLDFAAGARAQVYSQLDHPLNGDNHVGIILERGRGWVPGVWQLILRGEEVKRGDFDAWADRAHGITLIDFQGGRSDATTVTLPGNARRAITVGSFVSRPALDAGSTDIKGATAEASSLGPTRDGRVKPDLAAPGSLIMAPRIRLNGSPHCYDLRSGTSMAAPHVTGAIALFWGLWPALTAARIRDALYSTARRDVFTGATPNTNWGHGKLDIEAAFKALAKSVEKGETTVSNERVIEVDFPPQKKPSTGGEAGMHVRIEARGNELFIRGLSEGEEYVGQLILRKLKREGDAEVGGEKPVKTGGDECWVLIPRPPHWEDPCPIGGFE
jgi:hypothetical protein